jgi:hypothetical protein
MTTFRFAAILVFATTAGCSSSSSGGSADGGAADATEDVYSLCGHPGDMGNSLGVGKFCDHVTDCTDTPSAHLCSTLGDSTRHFCLMTCTPADAGGDAADAAPPPANQCGENATCECGSGGCGCTPNTCL